MGLSLFPDPPEIIERFATCCRCKLRLPVTRFVKDAKRCNMGRQFNGGTCPHELKRALASACDML
jgi:hypothetical protein